MSSLLPVPTALARRADEARREHPPELVDRLVAGSFEGDPLADSLVASFKGMPGGAGWKMLDEALLHGAGVVPGAPAQLEELLAPALEPPAWVDLDLVDAGALAYWRSGGLNLGLALMCGSLAYGYQSARLTRPLAATGRLERMAPRRLQETSRWVAVATRPGALRPGGDGLRATVRLRLVHALVRSHLLAMPGWDLGEWGVPISASDSLVTAIGGFMSMPLRALKDLGVRFSPAELEAMTHQWAWIGSLMGVPEQLIPHSYGEACETIEVALVLDDGPNEDSPKLMRALLYHGTEFPLEQRLPRLARRPARALKARFIGGFARRWMDDEMADRLGVPDTALTRLTPLLRPLTLTRELARASNLLGSDERIARIELAMMEWISTARSGPVETIAPHEAASEPVLSAVA